MIFGDDVFRHGPMLIHSVTVPEKLTGCRDLNIPGTYTISATTYEKSNALDPASKTLSITFRVAKGVKPVPTDVPVAVSRPEVPVAVSSTDVPVASPVATPTNKPRPATAEPVTTASPVMA
jgi:hypothetical protein